MRRIYSFPQSNSNALVREGEDTSAIFRNGNRMFKVRANRSVPSQYRPRVAWSVFDGWISCRHHWLDAKCHAWAQRNSFAWEAEIRHINALFVHLTTHAMAGKFPDHTESVSLNQPLNRTGNISHSATGNRF